MILDRFAPGDAPRDGRAAACVDPEGAPFRLWQAGRLLGSQAVNRPGGWNFSDLHTADAAAALAFYGAVFPWEVADLGPDADAMIRVPGYGDHLAATADPGIRERQAGAPAGFADAIGRLAPLAAAESPRWQVTFSVADRDASAEVARRLGGEVLRVDDSQWARLADVRDPQGAAFTISQFAPRG